MTTGLVIDSSAVVDALLGATMAAANTLLGKRLHAPCLIDFEVSSALRRLVRTNVLAPNVARDVLDQWSTLNVTRHRAEPLMTRMWDLRHNLTAYDAAYAALAEAMDAPLLTSDKRMARAASRYCEVMG